jgi:hypothetical protein
MTLSEEDKQRIREEELVRLQARDEYGRQHALANHGLAKHGLARFSDRRRIPALWGLFALAAITLFALARLYTASPAGY